MRTTSESPPPESLLQTGHRLLDWFDEAWKILGVFVTFFIIPFLFFGVFWVLYWVFYWVSVFVVSVVFRFLATESLYQRGCHFLDCFGDVPMLLWDWFDKVAYKAWLILGRLVLVLLFFVYVVPFVIDFVYSL